MVEHVLGKDEAMGSNPISSSKKNKKSKLKNGEWLKSGGVKYDGERDI